MTFTDLDPQGAERVVFVEEPRARLRAVIALDSTALGPAAGGCRMQRYPDDEAAIADARRLARGMSFKNAMAGLPLGGGKAVILRPEGGFDRPALMHAFGAAVDRLEGRYVTAEDAGTSVADMEAIREATRHVAGLPPQDGRAGGDPSPWTARGVCESIEAVARERLGLEPGALRVIVQGAGHVGAHLVRQLSRIGAQVVACDIDPERLRALNGLPGVATVVSEPAEGDGILAREADILAPCALGGVLNARTVPRLKVGAVVGAANNQLATPQDGAALAARGIVYAPDYVVNAGGIISVCAEYLREDEAQVGRRVAEIPGRLMQVLARAEAEQRPTAEIADALAAARIASARG